MAQEKRKRLRRVVVTGLGPVTPIGIGVEKFWNGLISGKSGVAPITRFDVTHYDTRIGAEVSDFNPLDFIDRKTVQRMDLFTQFAVAASELAVKDAELNAAEDKKKLEIVQSRNQADAAVHSVKKSLNEHGDKLDAGEKEKIEAAIKEVETALKGEDKAEIDAKTEALMTVSQKLGEKVYADMQAQQAAAAGGATGAANESTKPADDNVVDAEVKEVKKG